MTDTPIAILQKAADLGLKLSFKPPDTLDVKASGPWPKSFADTLRDHKSQLLALLRLPFVMVFSQILEETIFFCEDEDTKAALIDAGADSFSIYTRAELRVLLAQKPHRAALASRTAQGPRDQGDVSRQDCAMRISNAVDYAKFLSRSQGRCDSRLRFRFSKSE